MAKTPEYIKRAAGIVPEKRQLEYQQNGFYGMICFGMNTFTDTETGSGNEDPAFFNPKKLDCRRWAKLFKLSSMKGLILPVKFSDGFCLWQTETTAHSLKSSPWRNGSGDIALDTACACKEFKLKFGIYISILDLHEKRNCSFDEYNEFFKRQLTELCSRYGELFTVYLDSSGIKKDNLRLYDLEGFYSVIRQYQPQAAITFCGPDARWSGNDVGICRKSEWSVVPYYYLDSLALKDKKSLKKKINISALDLGSRKQIKKCDRLIWLPAQVEMSMRKGRFYHYADEYTVLPLNKIIDTYYNSVGSNAVFILSVPAMKDGAISQKETDTLLSVGAQLDIEFNENLAEGSVMTDNGHIDENHTGQKILEPGNDNFWQCAKGEREYELTLDLGDEYDIDKVVLAEHIATGQHIEQFSLFVLLNGKWKKLYKGTVIGANKIIPFKEVRARYFKLKIEKYRLFAAINKFEAY